MQLASTVHGRGLHDELHGLMGSVQDEPYVMMKDNAAFLTGNERFEGYVADILRLVAANLRFDYEISLSTDGKYGEQNRNGMWNGIVGEVARGVSSTRLERDGT